MAIVFRVTRAVQQIGAREGDSVVIDLDDADMPVSVVRAFPKNQLVAVLRHLDAFEVVSSDGSVAQLFKAVGLDSPAHGPGSHAEQPLRHQGGGAS